MKDVVVIGGGHNGLVAASTLAQAGRDVLLLEQRRAFGGFCASFEFYPGYQAAGLLHDTRSFRSSLVRGLGLAEDGLQLEDSPGLLAATDGDSVVLVTEASSPGQENGADPSGYPAWNQAINRFRPVVRQLLDAPPLPLLPQDGGDLWRLGKQGLALRRLGKPEMLELLRVLPMSAWDWLSEYHSNGLQAEALAFSAVQGGFFGPRAAGTAANLLLHACSTEKAVKGGPPALIRALVSNCRRSGVELRSGATVERIRLDRGRVAGVVLQSGEDVSAGNVLATCHPHTTFQTLLRPAELSMKLEAEVRSIRTRGTAALAHLALNRPLRLPPAYDARIDRVRWGSGSLEGLERVFDAAKYDEASSDPHLELTRLSRSIPGLAPDGGEAISVWLHCVPCRPDPEWNKLTRASLAETTLEKLTRLDPEIRRKTEAVHVLTPWDLETEFGLVGGQMFHVERTLDQSLMLRPCGSLAHYSTPIPGLYLGGSASHPGGGITGMPGYLAARCIIS